jgi:ankyrin repeat protein
MKTLPPELIHLIAGHLDADRDLLSFAQTSKRLYRETIDVLYKNHLKKGQRNIWFPKPLQWACVTGEEQTLKRALENLGDPTADGYFYGEAFYYACKRGQKELATRFLMELRQAPVQKEDWQTVQYWVAKALPKAARDGHWRIVELLIKEGALTEPGSHIGQALAWSAKNGHLGIIRRLIKGGADINEFDRTVEGTALTLAAASRRKDVVEYLLRKGANVQDDNNLGYYALYKAACNGDLDTVEALFNYGAQLDAVAPNSPDGNTALLIAVERGHGNVVDFLLRKGANVYRRNQKGHSALHIAARRGNLNNAKALINHGDIIGAIGHNDEFRNTPLFLAVQEGHMDVIRMLLNEGALGRPLNL